MAHARYWISVHRPAEADGDPPGSTQRETPARKRRFEATVLPDRTDGNGASWPVITMEIETRGARPTIRQISSDSGITSEALREVPLARLAKYATLALELGFGEGPVAEELASRLLQDDVLFLRQGHGRGPGTYGVHVTDSPATRQLWSEYTKIVAAAKQTERKARGRVTDDLLRRVAAVYRQAIDEGRPPKKAVQAAEGVSLTTAGKYIMRARERGYLGKTTAGKKGESGP